MIYKIQKFLKKDTVYYFNLFIQYLEKIDRIKIILYFFILYAVIIIIVSFKYSVIEYKYYKDLANKQQTTSIVNPVNRGTVYSNNDPIGVLATSTELSDLAIDPQETGSKEKLIDFLSDIVFEEICLGQKNEGCLNNLQIFLKLQELDDSYSDINYIKDKIKEEVKKRVQKEYLDSILIKESLSQEEIDKITILGQNGLYFVINNLYADPTKINDSSFVSKQLQDILKLQADELDNKLKKKVIRYVKILNKLNLQTKDKIVVRITNEKNAIQRGILSEDNSIYRFIILDPHPTRFYPEKNLASQILGFVDNANEGKYGIEGYFNEELKGQEGIKITKKDISGKAIGLDELSEKKIINGADIKLTIDRNIQKEVSRVLEAGVKEFKANKGSVIIMDPISGAIISMVSYPDFDPNNFGEVYELEKVNHSKYPNPGFDLLGMPVFIEDSLNGSESYLNGKKIKLRLASEKELGNTAIPKYKYKNNFGPGAYENDTISSLYEPGSVFKAVTVAIGIDTGDIRPQDMYRDKGSVEIDQFKISNVSQECTGYHTYSHALDWSCNVGMIDIVKKIGSSLFHKYIQDFGFGQKSNITLEGEVFGKIPPYEKWSRAKLFTMAFGQGITASLIQMAAAYSVIANGGVYMQPYIVDKISLPTGQVIENSPMPLRRVIKEETSKQIIAMLTEGAQIGFAKKGAVQGYDVAGKTGTSQIAYKGGYEEGGPGHTITSYGGFAPSSNPKFVLIVRIERPRTAVYAETTSSALFAKIAKYLLNYYGIPKSS